MAYGETSYRRKRRKTIRKFTYKMQKSLLICYALVILAMVGLVAVIVKINIKDGDRYTKKVLSQQVYTSSVIPFKRGDITDRNGTVMATSIKEYNMALDPAFILTQDTEGKYLYKDATLDVLCGYFGIDRTELENLLNEKSSSRYIVYKKNISSDDREGYADYLKEYLKNNDKAAVKGVTFEEEYVRKYPLGTTGSTIVGFTYDKNAGNWGIEGYYNSKLNGTDGKEFGYFDSELDLEPTVISPTNGNTVVSTVDINIQRIVEENIDKFCEQMGGKTVAVMMTNPQNGEILAMASSNGKYDPNNPQDCSAYWSEDDFKSIAYQNLLKKAVADEIYEEGNDNVESYYDEEEIKSAISSARVDCLNEMWRNYCVSDTYEPGSTYKPFVIATGLEDGELTGDETYTCNGSLNIAGANIHCANRSGHGTLTLEQGLMYSCNVVLMNVAEKIGKKTFLKYQNDFGFGYRTGVDIQGEATGLIFTEDQVGPQELATSSFGQGINVTMTQMTAAFGSLINGGNYYEPHVVKQILNDKGAVVEDVDKKLVKKTVSESTSATLRKYLYSTAKDGTGKTAAVEGYTIGGKTGTAQKLPRGNGKYLVSFLGFAAVEDEAKVICYVIVDEPNTESQAHSTYAQQLFSDIMADALPFLNVYPEGDEHAAYYGQDKNNTDDAKGQDGETSQDASEGDSQEEDEKKTDSNGDPVEDAVPFKSEDEYDFNAIEDDTTGAGTDTAGDGSDNAGEDNAGEGNTGEDTGDTTG